MKLISFPIAKPGWTNVLRARLKINKKILVSGIFIVLVLVVIGGYLVLQKMGKLPEANWEALLAKLAVLKIAKEATVPTQEFSLEELGITLPEVTAAGIYEETAEPGQGITHLARNALKKYLEKKGANLDLTPEHKIYIEDYLQKKTGERWLEIGEKKSFSEDLIKEGISKAQQLTPEQLENLKQYSSSVSF